MSIAIVYLHTLTGSLGSFRRVKEIGLILGSELDRQINIYTPYEKADSVIASRLRVRAVKSRVLPLNIGDRAYSLSKKVYYSKVFSRFLLRAIKTSGSTFVKRMGHLFLEDGVEAIQAEQDFSLPLALELGESLDLPVIADLHNITVEELMAAGLTKLDSPLYADFQKSMRDWLSRVDFVCVVSEEMKDYVETKYELSNSKILVVPPAGRLRRSNPAERTEDRIAFAGSVSYREHVDLYVKSLPFVKAQAPNATFYSTERGEDLSRIKRLCGELSVQMGWMWFPDEDELFGFLSSCSVGVLPSSNDMARIMGTPIKLFDYMSVGLPVVANRVGGWSSIVENEGVGLLTEDNPRDFASGILRLLGDEDLRMKSARNAIRAVKEKHNWEKSVESLVKAYESFL